MSAHVATGHQTAEGAFHVVHRTDAMAVRVLVLQQLELRGIPTDAGAGSKPH